MENRPTTHENNGGEQQPVDPKTQRYRSMIGFASDEKLKKLSKDIVENPRSRRTFSERDKDLVEPYTYKNVIPVLLDFVNANDETDIIAATDDKELDTLGCDYIYYRGENKKPGIIDQKTLNLNTKVVNLKIGIFKRGTGKEHRGFFNDENNLTTSYLFTKILEEDNGGIKKTENLLVNKEALKKNLEKFATQNQYLKDIFTGENIDENFYQLSLKMKSMFDSRNPEVGFTRTRDGSIGFRINKYINIRCGYDQHGDINTTIQLDFEEFKKAANQTIGFSFGTPPDEKTSQRIEKNKARRLYQLEDSQRKEEEKIFVKNLKSSVGGN